MSNKLLTIMTPTYNRCKYLKKLYLSLDKQSNKDFLWMVIDDGSEDDTEEVIKKYIKESSLEIKYYKQKNAGKYIAFNEGVSKTNTELFLCVDSDDRLLPDAVETIINSYKMIKEDNSCIGILSPRKMLNEKLEDMAFLINAPKYSTLMSLYNNKQLYGETALVFKTAILKHYLFPVLNNEKFMSESIIYNQIDQKYRFYVLNDQYYDSKYLKDGLTNNIIEICWKNPLSTLLLYQSNGTFQTNFIKGLKATSCYYAWKKINNLEELKMYKIPLYRRAISRFFVWYYVKVFNDQKTYITKNMEKLKETLEKSKTPKSLSL